MTYNEARAVVAAGRHLPGHFNWLVQEASRVVAWTEQDHETRMRGDLPTMSPQMREQINMALAMRLAVACKRMPFAAPVPVVRTKKAQGEGLGAPVAVLGVAA